MGCGSSTNSATEATTVKKKYDNSEIRQRQKYVKQNNLFTIKVSPLQRAVFGSKVQKRLESSTSSEAYEMAMLGDSGCSMDSVASSTTFSLTSPTRTSAVTFADDDANDSLAVSHTSARASPLLRRARGSKPSFLDADDEEGQSLCVSLETKKFVEAIVFGEAQVKSS